MVFFSCEGCNETLKKAQVENHIRRCGCLVSCVDCSQVFPGMSYQQHTSCISEAEKYEKSLYKGPKGGGKKKRDPQAEWMDLIGAAAAEVAGGAAASPLVRNNLQRMADLGNMPRNEKKFKNFLGNSLRINRPADQDELWQFLRKRLEAAAASSAAAAAAAAAAATANAAAATTGGAEGTGNGKGKGGGSSNGAESVDNKEDKEEEEQEQQQQQRSQQADRRGQKRKEAAVEAERKTGGGAEVKKQRAKGEAEGGGDFSWHKVIKKAVKGAGEGGVGLKALRKQVVAQALAAGVGLEEGKDGLKKVVKAQIGAVPGVVVRPDKTVVYDKKAK